jgi:hypothetical protein
MLTSVPWVALRIRISKPNSHRHICWQHQNYRTHHKKQHNHSKERPLKAKTEENESIVNIHAGRYPHFGRCGYLQSSIFVCRANSKAQVAANRQNKPIVFRKSKRNGANGISS